MLGAATRRGGSTARSCNTAGGRFSALPSGFGREGTHCGVAPLAQTPSLSGAARLALNPGAPSPSRPNAPPKQTRKPLYYFCYLWGIKFPRKDCISQRTRENPES